MRCGSSKTAEGYADKLFIIEVNAFGVVDDNAVLAVAFPDKVADTTEFSQGDFLAALYFPLTGSKPPSLDGDVDFHVLTPAR